VLEVPQMRDYPLLGVVANGACVDQDDVCFLDAVGEREAGLGQRGADQSGIIQGKLKGPIIPKTPRGVGITHSSMPWAISSE